AAVECAEADVAFARGAEAAAGGADDVGVVEQAIEEFPAREIVWCLDPDVWRVHAAIDLQAQLRERFADDAGVIKIEADELAGLLLALVAVNRFGAALDDIGDAVELGGVAAHPQAMQIDLRAVAGSTLERSGHDGVSAACAGEACFFREAAELD